MVLGVLLIAAGVVALCSLMGLGMYAEGQSFWFGFLIFPALAAMFGVVAGCVALIVFGVQSIAGAS